MGRGNKGVLGREERIVCDRLRQITPQSRLLRVDEAVDMLRDMYAEYRRRPVPVFTELVRRATDTLAADFVPRPVPHVPMPNIPATSASPASAPAVPAASSASPASASPATPSTSPAAAASPAPPSTASSPAPAPSPAAPRRDPAAEARAREKRLEEAGSVLNRALVERYKAVCV